LILFQGELGRELQVGSPLRSRDEFIANRDRQREAKNVYIVYLFPLFRETSVLFLSVSCSKEKWPEVPKFEWSNICIVAWLAVYGERPKGVE